MDIKKRKYGITNFAGDAIWSERTYGKLEAAHWLKIPANVGVSVGEHVDSNLLRRGVEIMFEDKAGMLPWPPWQTPSLPWSSASKRSTA